MDQLQSCAKRMRGQDSWFTRTQDWERTREMQQRRQLSSSPPKLSPVQIAEERRKYDEDMPLGYWADGELETLSPIRPKTYESGLIRF